MSDGHETPTQAGEEESPLSESRKVRFGTFLYETVPDSGPKIRPIRSARVWNPRVQRAPEAVFIGERMYVLKKLLDPGPEFDPAFGDGVMIDIPSEKLEQMAGPRKAGTAAKKDRNQTIEKLRREGMLFLASDEESLNMMRTYVSKVLTYLEKLK